MSNSHDTNIYILPKPHSIQKGKNSFTFSSNLSIRSNEESLLAEAEYLSNMTGLPLSENQDAEIILDLNQDFPFAKGFTVGYNQKEGFYSGISKKENPDSLEVKEGYLLNVTEEFIIITANTKHGIFNGMQTLLQLLPDEVYKNQKLNNSAEIECVSIYDYPRFPYRGMHLDVCRHFFSKEDIFKYIDLLAMHKMNTFHWHLTEDQGWRIEIDQYPKLSTISAYRKETLIGHYNDQPHKYDGKRYGGFYTKEEVKEIVQYASKRHITIIPEIEMPGHSQAVLAAYPELGCTSGPFETMTKWGVSDNVFCPKEETFTFLENVLTEVMEMFPSEYIHIGGDECPKIRWKESEFCQNLMKKEGLEDENALQSYFIKRIESFLNKHGRNIIGWDEILEGGLAKNATVMSWRGITGGIEAAQLGHKVIMTPNSHMYLDYYQSDHPKEPLAIGGFLPLETVYNYEPLAEELSAEQSKYILGVQGNVWTEYIPDFSKVEYMAFPRACAIAEIGWTLDTTKDYKNFIRRLSKHFGRLDALNVNYANHIADVKTDIQSANGLVVQLENQLPDSEIRFTLDGSIPNMTAQLYSGPIPITSTSTLRASTFKEGTLSGREAVQEFLFNKATGKNIKLKNQPADRYSKGGIESVINGVNGSDERYGDKEWLGFEGGIDFDGTINFGELTTVSKVTLRFFKGEGQWIYLPKAVMLYSSKDNLVFNKLRTTAVTDTDTKVKEHTIELKTPVELYQLQIVAKNYGEIPEGKQGGGHKAWLFVDEIIVE